jgi:hypothetical protein
MKHTGTCFIFHELSCIKYMPRYPLDRIDEWAPEPVQTLRWAEHSFSPCQDWNPFLRPPFQQPCHCMVHWLNHLGISHMLELSSRRAIAPAVTLRLFSTATRVQSKIRYCGICDGQSGSGEYFLRVLRFPLPTDIPQTDPCSLNHPIIEAI